MYTFITKVMGNTAGQARIQTGGMCHRDCRSGCRPIEWHSIAVWRVTGRIYLYNVSHLILSHSVEQCFVQFLSESLKDWTAPLRVLWYKRRGILRFYRKFFYRAYPRPLFWLVTLSVWARFGLLAPVVAVKQQSHELAKLAIA